MKPWPLLMVWLAVYPAWAEDIILFEQVAPDAVRTLGDLKPRFVEFKTQPLPKIPVREVYQRYRELLEITDDPLIRRNAIHRLVNLELLLADELDDADIEAGRERLVDIAILTYTQLLGHADTTIGQDELRYQLAWAYDLAGDGDNYMAQLTALISDFPDSSYAQEAHFRRGEHLYTAQRYDGAVEAYRAVLTGDADSPFYSRALYMLGWALFQEQEYYASIIRFTQVFDDQIRRTGELDAASDQTREVLDDSLRAISIGLNYLDGVHTIERLLADIGDRPYAFRMYQRLSAFYLEKELYKDAAETSAAFIALYPFAAQAPQFRNRSIEAWEKARLLSRVWQEKERFVSDYGIGSAYWQQADDTSRQALKRDLDPYLTQLAQRSYVRAQQAQAPGERLGHWHEAAAYLEQYLATFPHSEASGESAFLLGEARSELGLHADAVEAYELAAYGSQPFDRRAESGYAALLAYHAHESALEANATGPWKQREIASARRFVDTFPKAGQAPQVLAGLAVDEFGQARYREAIAAAEQLLAWPRPVDQGLKQNTLLVLGHARFEQQQFAQAEQAYEHYLQLAGANAQDAAAVTEKIAAAIYRQAEQAHDTNQLDTAVGHFLRVGERAPQSRFVVNGHYDAAALLLETQQWARAIALLDGFRRQYRQHPLADTVPEKLIYAYEQSGDAERAADELVDLALQRDAEFRRKAWYQAAGMYRDAQAQTKAIALLRRYVDAFPEPLDTAMEARVAMLKHYETEQQQSRVIALQQEIIAATDAAIAADRATPRARYLAAEAAYALAERDLTGFNAIRLRAPLKQSLQKKQRALKRTLAAYQRVLDYRVADFHTAASYQVADLYRGLGRDILNSERPGNLNDLEREQYDILLEEQAYPFEEKAIALHIANIKNAKDGIYDKWVQESYAVLSTMDPGRFAKQEKSVLVSRDIR